MPPTDELHRPEAARAERRPASWRVVVSWSVAVACLCVSTAVLWDQDLRYSLPTPVPEDLEPPILGTHVLADARVAALLAHHRGRPLLVHTFGAECPCSWFNADHVRNLAHDYGDRVDFVGLVVGPDAREALEAFAEQDLGFPAIVDVDDRIAHALGVYATPQAVLLDGKGRLDYRGNYNLSRYCIDPLTEFARIAIDALLAGRAAPQFSAAAAIAYGCSLPTDLEPGAPR